MVLIKLNPKFFDDLRQLVGNCFISADLIFRNPNKTIKDFRDVVLILKHSSRHDTGLEREDTMDQS